MDLPEIPSVKNKKTYLQIVDTILDLIARGKLEYGKKLYNEQELVELMGSCSGNSHSPCVVNLHEVTYFGG